MTALPLGASAGRERAFSDFLFAAQLACAVGFGGAQFTTMQTSIAGVSITWIGLWLAFVLINLGLALNAARARSDRVIQQTVVVYAVWAIVAAIVLADLLWLGAEWTLVDNVTSALTGSGIALAVCIGRRQGAGLSDPLVRAGFAIACKCVPQLTLAWNIFRDGGEGVAIFAIIAGHVMITMRLLQVALASRQGWDRNRQGIALGELANELSWIVVTVVWFVVR